MGEDIILRIPVGVNMILPPLEVIASWPLPNYDDPITRGPAPIIFNLVLFPLVCFFIALRMYTRLCISKSFGLDDWLILATLVRSLSSNLRYWA